MVFLYNLYNAMEKSRQKKTRWDISPIYATIPTVLFIILILHSSLNYLETVYIITLEVAIFKNAYFQTKIDPFIFLALIFLFPEELPSLKLPVPIFQQLFFLTLLLLCLLS